MGVISHVAPPSSDCIVKYPIPPGPPIARQPTEGVENVTLVKTARGVGGVGRVRQERKSKGKRGEVKI